MELFCVNCCDLLIYLLFSYHLLLLLYMILSYKHVTIYL